MAFGRLPNGLGTITKLKANLRKPYRARKLVGEDLDEQTMKVRRIYRTVGYYPTRKDAMEALMSDTGVSSQDMPMTFKNVYEAWSAKHFQKITVGSAKNYRISFESMPLLWDRVFRDLRPADYEKAVEGLKATRQVQCRLLLSQLYQYGLRHDICEKDYSKLVEFETKWEKHTKTPFSVDEVKRLWDMPSGTTRNMILIGIYTGFRPGELLELERDRIINGCLVGGKKTENGKNRLVPIHPSILPLVEEEARKSAFFGSTTLFCNTDGKQFPSETYFSRVRKLFPDHTPHETRHTFATFARRSGMDPIIIKRIMGHTIKDMTETVYTHIDADILIKEIEKFKIE